MRHIKNLFLTLAFAVFLAAPVMTIVATPVAYADAACDGPGFLGIPAWYKGLSSKDKTSGQCAIDSPGSEKDALSKFIWHIALNVIEIALYIVGYIAVFFVLYGGFQFLTGGSNPSQIEKARKTILNAVVGLVISISAVILVNLIFGILG